MDTMKLMINGEPLDLHKSQILNIHNGKAQLITTMRWYPVICECLSIKDYETVPDSEAPNGNGYIVCEVCNKIHYLKDLRP